MKKSVLMTMHPAQNQAWVPHEILDAAWHVRQRLRDLIACVDHLAFSFPAGTLRTAIFVIADTFVAGHQPYP